MIPRYLIAVGLSILTLAAPSTSLRAGTPSAQVAASTPPRAGAPQAAAAIAAELALTRTLPIDPAVSTGRLPNGLRYFVRQNARPANRVAMRLAVNAGAIQEEPDQRGLAHFLEHMAFNGTENFKPGELVSFLESIGARFGPHVNASTSFDETIYMLEMPTDRAGYIDRGMLVLRDFAAGISLLPAEVEKERGVVLEEWRGRLGAGSRLTDKQLPVIFQGSRYAERLPIGLPEVLKSAPRERLLAFYQQWYRPDNMAVVVVGDIPVAEAEALVRKHFAGIPAAKGAPAAVDTSVPAHKDTLINMSTDPEAQGWSVSIGFKGKAEHDLTVGGYRKTLVENLVSQMLNLRLRDLARRPNAPFLGAQAGTSNIGRELELFEIEASVPEGKITEGLGALMLEARRMQQYGFSDEELNRAKAGLMAGYERAYKERETSESAELRQRVRAAFPRAGTDSRNGVRVPDRRHLSADRDRGGSGRAGEGIHHRGQPRRARRGSREEGPAAARARDPALGDRPRRQRAGRAVGGSHRGSRTGREAAGARNGGVEAFGSRDRRQRADAVERRGSVAEAHRLQERSDPVQRLRARRRVAREREGLQERQPRHRHGRGRRPRRIESSRPQQAAVRQDRAGLAVDLGLHPGRERLGHAEGSRNRAAAQLPGVHRAELYARRARSGEAPPVGIAAEPRSESARGLRGAGRQGQYLGSLQRRRR